MLNGIINIYKEAGYTSRDAVSRLSGILRQRKIGHTGTLDPAAEGVLPMCCGTATKLCEWLMADKKEYRAVMKLGYVTDTEDTTGVVTEEKTLTKDWCEENLTEENIRRVLSTFLGEQEQIPPMYSAKKVKGKKLYELAREGKVIERKPSRITIFKIDLDEINLAEKEISITVECSKGTYIRTLCKDIGARLGTLSCMKHLIRSRSGSFSMEESFTLNEIEVLIKENRLHEVVLPVEKVFASLKEMRLIGHDSLLLDNGAPFSHGRFFETYLSEELIRDGEKFRMYNEEGIFRAVYSFDGVHKVLKVFKMF